MSYQLYLVLHLIGIFMILTSLGGITLHVMNGGSRQFAMRKWAAAFHGIGLLLAIVSGFGLMVRLAIPHNAIPVWVWVKIVVWLILGGLPTLIYRQARMAKLLWILIFVFAAINTYMAVYKPGSGSPATTPEIDASAQTTETAPASEPTPEATPAQ